MENNRQHASHTRRDYDRLLEAHRNARYAAGRAHFYEHVRDDLDAVGEALTRLDFYYRGGGGGHDDDDHGGHHRGGTRVLLPGISFHVPSRWAWETDAAAADRAYSDSVEAAPSASPATGVDSSRTS